MLSSLCLVSCYAFSCQNKYFFGCGKTFCLHYRHLTPEARNYRPVNNILDILSKLPEQPVKTMTITIFDNPTVV